MNTFKRSTQLVQESPWLFLGWKISPTWTSITVSADKAKRSKEKALVSEKQSAGSVSGQSENIPQHIWFWPLLISCPLSPSKHPTHIGEYISIDNVSIKIVSNMRRKKKTTTTNPFVFSSEVHHTRSG
jgi:hypothetical protein